MFVIVILTFAIFLGFFWYSDFVCENHNHHDDFIETNLFVGLKKPSDQYSCGEDLAAVSCKRKKIDDVSTLLPNFFISSSSSSSNDHHDSYHLHHQVLGSFRSGSKENNNTLDLDLKLGDPPKVK
ncbi:hypothetical protein QYF36_007165 [Acer negundo]|nr:hypothetical protein QYF36_007165 [Acer negundo]